MVEHRSGICPYCDSGEIVEDKFADKVFFCNNCKHEITIGRFEQ